MSIPMTRLELEQSLERFKDISEMIDAVANHTYREILLPRMLEACRRYDVAVPYWMEVAKPSRVRSSR